MNTTQYEYSRPAFAFAALTLLLPLSCIIINCSILLRVIVKPHLWSLVNLFLSLLLGIIHNFFLVLFDEVKFCLVSNLIYGTIELALPFLFYYYKEGVGEFLEIITC